MVKLLIFDRSTNRTMVVFNNAFVRQKQLRVS